MSKTNLLKTLCLRPERIDFGPIQFSVQKHTHSDAEGALRSCPDEGVLTPRLYVTSTIARRVLTAVSFRVVVLAERAAVLCLAISLQSDSRSSRPVLAQAPNLPTQDRRPSNPPSVQEASLQADPDSEARLQLQLGAVFEGAERWEEAEKAYASATNAHSVGVRREAFESLRRVIKERESRHAGFFQSTVVNALSAGVTALFTVVLTLLLIGVSALLLGPLVGRWGRWRGKNKLMVFPSDVSGPLVTASSFPTTVGRIYELVRYHFERRATIWVPGFPQLPHMVRSQTADIVQLLAEAAPGAGKFLQWLAEKARRPEYGIYSTLESDGTHVRLSVRLERRGTPLQWWGTTFPLAGLFAEQRDVGYRALIFLKEHMHGNHAL